jgi:hypothetical protein
MRSIAPRELDLSLFLGDEFVRLSLADDVREGQRTPISPPYRLTRFDATLGVLVVGQEDGAIKALLPYRRGDGRSAAEAIHALAALNAHGALVEALRHCLPRVHPRLADDVRLRAAQELLDACERLEKTYG